MPISQLLFVVKKNVCDVISFFHPAVQIPDIVFTIIEEIVTWKVKTKELIDDQKDCQWIVSQSD